jgi:nitroreductase
MQSQNSNKLASDLEWRYATKVFDNSRTISASDWSALEESLRLAPSSFGLQPWHFCVITDSTLKERLKPASWNQPQITDASHLVVFAVKNVIDQQYIASFVQDLATARGVAAESLKGYQDMMEGSLLSRSQAELKIWGANQVYIALGFFLSACANLRIDACPMEGIDPAQYDSILGLPEKGFSTVVAATAGYRSSSDKYATAAKVRFSRDRVISHRS